MPDSMLNNIFHEETHDPLYADRRNFYKVEKWNRNWMRVVRRRRPRQGASHVRANRQGPAAHPADRTPADAGAGRVAATGAPLASCYPLFR